MSIIFPVTIVDSLHLRSSKSKHSPIRLEVNLLQSMLPKIWLSPAEIDGEKTAAWEENALVSD